MRHSFDSFIRTPCTVGTICPQIATLTTDADLPGAQQSKLFVKSRATASIANYWYTFPLFQSSLGKSQHKKLDCMVFAFVTAPSILRDNKSTYPYFFPSFDVNTLLFGNICK